MAAATQAILTHCERQRIQTSVTRQSEGCRHRRVEYAFGRGLEAPDRSQPYGIATIVSLAGRCTSGVAVGVRVAVAVGVRVVVGVEVGVFVALRVAVAVAVGVGAALLKGMAPAA